MKKIGITLGLIGALAIPTGCATVPSAPQETTIQNAATVEIAQRRRGGDRFRGRDRFRGGDRFRGRDGFRGRWRPNWWGRRSWWGRGTRPYWWNRWYSNRFIVIGGYYYPYYLNEGYYYPDYSSPYTYTGGVYAPYYQSQPALSQAPIPQASAQTIGYNPQERMADEEGQQEEQGPPQQAWQGLPQQ